ncbi:DNA (cytosine-5-)-methyltransferase [Acutalibacter sp. 1XD8-36]|uniref:DNA (cytosine-5-)-methyltransferase n=1 Tax=Acutalibacter sp. 1XD8-36 TaxID=2320852 RepID=UPI003FA4BCEC
MFAGIGGFRSGLEAVGGFECVGHCEIDRYANQAYNAMYNTKGECFFADARTIDPGQIPDIDLICGGFPCQSFSIAGKRRGFADDARGTLFFEIARLAAAKRPAFLLLENVPGLLSHDGCRTFAAILSTLDELGYDVAWQVLNSKNFGVPQSRKRVYIVGYLRGKCSGEILSFTDTNGASLEQVLPGPEGCRVYSPSGVSITLTSSAGGFGGRSGLYDVSLPIKVMTKAGYQLAHPGDSIDLAYATMNTRRGRVGDKIAHTVTPGNNQGYFFIDLNENPELTENARCLLANQDAGIGKFKGGKSGVFVEGQAPFAVPVQDADGNLHYGKVRKLMPIECWRLQGFSDDQFHKAASTGLSDAQLYKMAGNAVTVPVISALGEKIKEIYWRSQCQTM